MKNKRIIKILTFALCIIAISSLLVSAKEFKEIKNSRSLCTYFYDPHPAGGEFPE